MDKDNLRFGIDVSDYNYPVLRISNLDKDGSVSIAEYPLQWFDIFEMMEKCKFALSVIAMVCRNQKQNE